MKKMMWVLLCGLVSAGLLASVAFGAEGPYVSVQAGATWLEDTDVDYDDFDNDTEVEFDTGFNVGAAAGYDYGMARLEAEIAYRENDLDDFDDRDLAAFAAVLPVAFDIDGDISTFSFMVNGYWDIENESSFTPYLGAGIGLAVVSLNDVKVEVSGPGGSMDVDFIDDDDTVFAYQLAAGVGFDISETLILDLNYRYFATDDPELEDEYGDDLEAEYDSHNVSIGLRFMF